MDNITVPLDSISVINLFVSPVTGEFHPSLLTTVTDLPKSFASQINPQFPVHVIVSGTKGKFFKNREDAISCITKGIRSEIRSLEKNSDLRPSEVRRLDFLKGLVTL